MPVSQKKIALKNVSKSVWDNFDWVLSQARPARLAVSFQCCWLLLQAKCLSPMASPETKSFYFLDSHASSSAES